MRRRSSKRRSLRSRRRCPAGRARFTNKGGISQATGGRVLCHEPSRCRWLLLSQDDAVVRDRHRGPRALPRPRQTPARPGSDDRSALKQQPAATGPRVANQQSHARRKQQRDVCRQPRAIRLAHHPGEAAVLPGAARLLSTWHCYSAAGAPADAKAITRLVPRRDNQRDRDVVKPLVNATRGMIKAIVAAQSPRWSRTHPANASFGY